MILFLLRLGILPLVVSILQKMPAALQQVLRWKRKSLFGTRIPSASQWERALEASDRECSGDLYLSSRLPKNPSKLVTVIVSSYQSGIFLDGFLNNLLSQTIFIRCEVIVISVLPTPEEKEKLIQFSMKHKNVKVIFQDFLSGIYSSWNLAIKSSSCEFITNMNLDDMRHPKSLELQAHELIRTGADVVYQNFYLSLQPNLSWNEICKAGFIVSPPEVTTESLLNGSNAPHNAPMWRRTLHVKNGLFDETLSSAGDHDFWIRAALSGANFEKILNPHVAYYLNPLGMSTKSNSPGAVEGARILHKYRKSGDLFN